MLTHIKIEKLFGQFDYDIELKKGGITLLTGPNGYGKTTILNILYAFSISNFLFFIKLHFVKIEFNFKGLNSPVIIIKEKDSIKIIQQDKDDYILNRNSVLRMIKEATKNTTALHNYGDTITFDKNNPLEIDNDIAFEKYFFMFNEENGFNIFSKYMLYGHLIREQRLLRLKLFDENKNLNSSNYFDAAITKYAKELKLSLNIKIKSYSSVSQMLDNSFPKRLFEQNEDIKKEEFIIKFDKIKETQKLLNYYGIFAFTEDNEPSYKKENSKALLIYLNDTEKKLKVFSVFLEKLNVFTEIINKKQFSNKTIKIDKDKGFFFVTDDGEELPLTLLSSGEQQEVILLYQLLFKVEENSLVLIDEPETGLHVAWQKEFIKDLKQIIELQNFTAIVATHSPQIINNYWDLTVDLWDISENKNQQAVVNE